MLTPYYQQDAEIVTITREQGSQFAKKIADDFNPLHDVDAKKFCVPGDLLFSLVLSRYGVSENMYFKFEGMVDETSQLQFPEAADEFAVTSNDKVMLSVKRDGETSQCPTLIESLTKNYVAFSGTTFPHMIVPVMGEKEVMINPARPMVIYESMAIHFDDINVKSVELETDTPEFEYEGKRGKIILKFNFISEGKKVGRGEKHMLVSGIKAYDQQAIDDLIAYYNERKATL
ncbi:DUF3581 family protein [Pseudoalteromonas phenolica]|uniref:DUF3581 domain-containing protein n=1 Tax=Pseudoalteromonas phenolica TaxID=161398 RepID=A0A0S2JZQ7_9GAMM|nr:DUF3581 family protein [Pseudoalteromonas phenolica]ALO41269.1 hypothetical protein PP2015_750 [Pseudoalteromonas phenolica]MBE0354192.1 hypothetical protein [Pseudoalteromonas phenolica O-BC30]TMO53964.1 DUF3581 domain-containing protein [Pseudoalteromonas phenolica]